MMILVACEESQVVTIELRKLGHEAFSCDIQETSGDYPEYHYKRDVLGMLNLGWDMIIAFPPCTYLSKAGATRLYPNKQLNLERFEKVKKAAKFFLAIWNAPCQKICIENPIQFKIAELPVFTQQIEPYMFGDPYKKATRLWLKGLPKLKPTKILEEYRPWVSSTKNGLKSCAKQRSKTFPVIARAMATQFTLL